eukprot:TRINITY_DN3165_c0_g1_i4.p1 TRINITY_DN3165_c0_g1~~TRINITY_DN3165_c0_g1_i4.p1  ORF type:complete len:208 (-),score=10.18 TRINITY_DN3165_c0_g1_i4:4-627(-)
MTQYFNFAAVKRLSTVFKNKSLVVPHFRVEDVRQIDFKRLNSAGFKGVIFDKDNTLTVPYHFDVHPILKNAVKEFQFIFGKHAVVFSNTIGSKYDSPNFEQAKHFESVTGIPVIRHQEQKPGGFREIMDYFKCEPHELVLVGDRYFTDIMFGNTYGMLTFHTKILTHENENIVVKNVRKLESLLVERWIREGIEPPEHSLQIKYSKQ